MLRSLSQMLFCAFLLYAWSSSVKADEWTHWRGPKRDGSTSEPSGWREGVWELANEKWRVQVPVGGGSPIVVANQLYVFGWKDGAEILTCHDASTGKSVWTKSYPAPIRGRYATGDEGLYAGPSSTPEYDPTSGLIYTLGNDGDLRCWDSKKEGRLVWETNLYDAFDVQQRTKVERSPLRDYGYTSSPLVLGDQLIIEVGAEEGTLISFNKINGDQLWRSEANSLAGHNGGPALVQVNGEPHIASFAYDGLLVTSAGGDHPGRTLAEVPWRTHFAQQIASPFVHEQDVVITSGYNQQRMAKYRLSADSASEEWQTKAFSTICTPVLHNGSLYWACQTLHRVDFETGEVLWQSERTGDAGSCIMTSDDKMIVWCNRGDLLLVDLPVDKKSQPNILVKKSFEGLQDVWPHAAIADGRLYLRDRSGILICCGHE